MLYQSPEYNHRSLVRLLDPALIGPRTRVLIGCHNYAGCKKRLLVHMPTLPAELRARVTYFFWSLREPSVLLCI